MTYNVSSGARSAVMIAVAAVLPAAQTTVTPALDKGVTGQL
jgi:hypothetical protein